MVRPGITGWAQVRYQYANNVEEEVEKLKYDLYYVKYVSAALDLRILVETVKVLLTSRPASERPPAPALAARAEAAAPAPINLSANVNQTHAA
jgi:hypothetical protein